jgi:penicillin-binding protein 2
MSFTINVPEPLDRSILLRLAFLSALSILLLGALLARLWFLQVLAGDRFAELADSNRLRTVVSQAPRGHILAQDGTELVRNRPSLALTADRQALVNDAGRPRSPEAERAVTRLADLLQLDVETVLTRINDRRYSPFRPVPVAVDVAPELVFAVRQNQELFLGVSAETLPVRDYPQGDLAAHLVGYLGQISREELADPRYADYRGGDLVGRGGLEQSYEADLRGSSGQRILVVNRRGNVLDVQSDRAPVAGHDLVTWLDLDIQRATEDALREGIIASRSIRRTDGRLLPSTAGSAIVMDARTGGIIAMASYPTFDPREFIGGVSRDYWEFVNDPAQAQPLTNRPIAGQYPPGSVFKIVSGAAMLDAGLVTPASLVGCPGSFTVADVTFRNWNPANEGPMTLGTALKRSCDTYFYALSFRQWQREQREETPDEVIQRVARSFGMGQRLGVDLPGEQAGVVPGRTWRQEFWLRYRDGYCTRAEAAPVGSLERALLTDLCRFGGLWRGGDAVNLSIGQGDLLSGDRARRGAHAADGRLRAARSDRPVRASYRARGARSDRSLRRRDPCHPAWPRARRHGTRGDGGGGLRRLPPQPGPGGREDGDRRAQASGPLCMVRCLRAVRRPAVCRRRERRGGRGRIPDRCPHRTSHPGASLRPRPCWPGVGVRAGPGDPRLMGDR